MLLVTLAGLKKVIFILKSKKLTINFNNAERIVRINPLTTDFGTREAIALGFDGKGVIHPGQIKPIHDTFVPEAEQTEHAHKVMTAIKEAEESGTGVAAPGSKMIDALDFNVNVNTHSDGYLLHGIGGFADAADAHVTIMTVPPVRGRVPIIMAQVTTITTPGETVDVIVTEHGIAINPRRQDLVDMIKGSDLPIKPIEELYRSACSITAVPEKPNFTDCIVAVIENRDGTMVDTVQQLIPKN